MRAAPLGLLALIAVTTTPQVIAAQFEEEIARFQLFNNCQRILLLIEDPGEGAATIGLTKERLQSAAESRLRGARLYSERIVDPYLYVQVTVVGGAFSVQTRYVKRVFDPASNQNGGATTWMQSITGTHVQNVENIVSGLLRLVDQFLTEYLRVNEAACNATGPIPDGGR